MQTISKAQPPSPPWVNRLIVGLLSASFLAATGAGLSVWKQSALIQQHIITVDNKYLEKSNRVVKRLDALSISFSQHCANDATHRLLIQEEHINFKNFMNVLSDAYEDIEDNAHTINLMQQGCCIK